MSRPRTVTHAYRIPGGWVKLPHRPLNVETAHALRDQGYTLVRARRGWTDVREISLAQFATQDDAARRTDADGTAHHSSAA